MAEAEAEADGCGVAGAADARAAEPGADGDEIGADGDDAAPLQADAPRAIAMPTALTRSNECIFT